jgi:hypothetical protein
MTVVEFPKKQKPWMSPQPDIERKADLFVSVSPYGSDLAERLSSCRTPFIRAAIIRTACGPEDVPFLLRIAEMRD